MRMAKLKRILAVVMLSSISFAVYAEDAPVYEADNYPPPFDGQSADSDGMVDGNMPTIVHRDPYAAQPSRDPYAAQPSRDPYVAAPPAPARPLTLDQRLARMEQQIKNMEQSSSLSRFESLQKEIQMLRGQLDELNHQLQQAQAQQKAMYADMDKRLREVSIPHLTEVASEPSRPATAPALPKASVKTSITASAVTKTVSAAPKATESQRQVDSAEEQQIYQTAYDLIRAKKYNEAINTLQKMLQKYPTGPTAANAHYWLGELYALLNKNEQSTSEYQIVVKKYPNSPKAADAQLKLGLTYMGQLKWPEAKMAFKKVINRFPGTASSRLASEQLAQIKKAGH